MTVEIPAAHALETAVTNGSIKVPGVAAAISSVRCRLLGVDAYLLISLDEHEHQRRQAAGLTAIGDPDVLRLLSRLPHGEAVGVADLTGTERRSLALLPPGTAEIAGGRVTRLALPPLALRLAIVTDHAVDRGLDRASRFAPFAPRLLVLTGPADDLAFAEAEARFYGIGLATAGVDGLVMRADPEPPRRAVGPVTWRIREEAYATFLSAGETGA